MSTMRVRDRDIIEDSAPFGAILETMIYDAKKLKPTSIIEAKLPPRT